MSRVKWYDNTHNFSILLKRNFYLLRFKSEGQQRPGDVSLMQSDCKWLQLNAPLTLRASYLPLPPPSSSPSSHTCPLSPSSLIQHMVHRGVSTQLPLITIIGILNLQLTFFALFSLLLHTRTFFAIPLAEKMHPLFQLIVTENPFFPLSSLSRFLLLLNEYANYLYRRIWNLPVNPARRVPGFMEGKVDSALSNPCFMTLPSDFTTSEFPISNYLNFQNFC
jgi:hypothetical protein